MKTSLITVAALATLAAAVSFVCVERATHEPAAVATHAEGTKLLTSRRGAICRASTSGRAQPSSHTCATPCTTTRTSRRFANRSKTAAAASAAV